ncbi:NAD-dependent epimerase/dehydratase family protein [Nonomuraea sp. H19]|uniref:NAD-dependent epimerase/dehydratase family protein n=1 Tax=Nonomuraea sp. H19 TaxID=3452206 RepID=UPI003F89EF29
MRVFVTGGTGAIGGHAVPALLAAGHAVTALARTPAKAAALERQGAAPVRVSLFDREALASAFAGHDAVVNLASAIPPMSRFMSTQAMRDNHRVRDQGSAAVADAALAAGVGRVVQESVCMVYRDQGDRWIDEDAPVDRYPLTRGNFAAESNAHRFTQEGGGAGVALRFGWFYGPGALHSEQMYALAGRHVGLVFGRPGGYVSAIHMADAATAVVAALEAPAGTYNVVDDEPLTKRDFADALARATGARMWLRVPGRAAHLFGHRLTSLTRSLRVANARLRASTGWTPRHPSAREGWRATAAVLTP